MSEGLSHLSADMIAQIKKFQAMGPISGDPYSEASREGLVRQLTTQNIRLGSEIDRPATQSSTRPSAFEPEIIEGRVIADNCSVRPIIMPQVIALASKALVGK